MSVFGFLLGGVVGLAAAIALRVLTDAGWGSVIAVYFLVGYGTPVLFLVLAKIRCALITRLQRQTES
jgi:hypothetical protein